MDKAKGEEDPLYIVGEGIRPLPPLSARAPAVLPLALQRYYRWAPGSAKALPPPRKSSQKGPSTNNRSAGGTKLPERYYR